MRLGLLRSEDGPQEYVHLASSTITVLLFVIAVVAGVWSWFAKSPSLFVFFGAFALGNMLAVALFASRALVTGTRQPADNRSYEVKSQSLHYFFLEPDGENHRYVVDTTIVARRNDVAFFEQRLAWLAHGTSDAPTTSTPGCQVLGPVPRGDYDSYMVHFGRPLAEGETKQFRFEQVLHDPGRTMKAILSKRLREPYHELALTVHFCTGRSPLDGKVYYLEEDAIQPNVAANYAEIPLDPAGQVAAHTTQSGEPGTICKLFWYWSGEPLAMTAPDERHAE